MKMLHQWRRWKFPWPVLLILALSLAACAPDGEEQRVGATAGPAVTARAAAPATATGTAQLQPSLFVRVHWFGQEEQREAIAQIEAIRRIDYGSGPTLTWLELSPEAFARLEQTDVAFERVQNPTTLRFGSYQFDTRAGEPPFPAGLRGAETEGEPRLYLVQLVAPLPTDAWLAQIEGTGAEILAPVGAHAYLVWMAPAQQAEVLTLEFIRWTGLYHPAYKIGRGLLERAAEDPRGMIENTTITIYDDGRPGGTLAQTLAAIEALGGAHLGGDGPKHLQLAGVQTIFALPAEALLSVARMNTVIGISYRQPVDLPEG